MLSVSRQGRGRGQLAVCHGSTVVCQPHCPALCSPLLAQRIYLTPPLPLPPHTPPLTVHHIHSELDQSVTAPAVPGRMCQEDGESPCCQKQRFHIIQTSWCVMLNVASISKSCSFKSYLRASAHGFLCLSYSPHRPLYFQQHCMHEQVSQRHARNSKNEA